jgi:methylenetetrahydrofolate dehydrogenase (NADP+)/methenyltetrahydrofolate cyclohydrolase
MSAQLLDGKQLAATRRQQLAQQVLAWQQQGHPPPGLAVILVGNDAASEIYVENKRKACAQANIEAFIYHLPEDTTQSQLLEQIHSLNQDNKVNGLIIQLPLPAHIDEKTILKAVNPAKDVDGFHPYNMGCLVQRSPGLRPSTPHGIMLLLEHYQIPLKQRNACIIGASNIVGRPMALELLLAGSTVTVCHKFTRDLATHVQRAEILVVAIGKPGVIQSEWLQPGCVVVDVGITRLTDGRITGDIDFASAAKIAGWITPVPGGVGPMTIQALLENTFYATQQQQNTTHS